MKSISLPLLLATGIAILSLSACDKLKDQVQLPDIFANSKDITFDIPPTAAGSEIQSADVPFDLKSELAAGNTSGITLSPSNVKSAKVSKVSMDITSGSSATNNFANFIAGGIAMYSDVAPTQLTVAQVIDNPDVYTTHLEVPLTGTTDISSYLKGSVLTYAYGYTLRRATTVPLHIVMHLQYDIALKL